LQSESFDFPSHIEPKTQIVQIHMAMTARDNMVPDWLHTGHLLGKLVRTSSKKKELVRTSLSGQSHSTAHETTGIASKAIVSNALAGQTSDSRQAQIRRGLKKRERYRAMMHSRPGQSHSTAHEAAGIASKTLGEQCISTPSLRQQASSNQEAIKK
jgi:hypothetical protein